MIREPELYALTHRGTPGDEAFYLDACAGAGSVLELGCGYGRLLLPLAGAGHRVIGLDCDPGLLGLARQAAALAPASVRERITLQQADMRSFALDARFDRILIPFGGLYCLPGEDEQLRCLARAARHLAPHGLLLFDAWPADDFHAHADPGAVEDEQPVVSVEWRGTVWDVHEHSRWERDAQRLEVRYEYRPRDGGPVRADTLEHRYLLSAQVPDLCRRAGLRLEALLGDFQGAPFDARSEWLACIARPA